MKTLSVTFLLLCIISLGYSQTDLRQGYIITHANDTLHGILQYRQGAASYRSCDFRHGQQGDVTTYFPEDIAGYGFLNDKYFQSRKIDSVSSTPVFIEVVVKGRAASLYRHDQTYFVEKDHQGLHKLTNESRLTYVNDRRVTRNTNEFIGICNMLFFDCTEVRQDIKQLKLGEASLTKLVEAYNKCRNEPSITFKGNKPWLKAGITIGGGLNVSTFKGEDVLNSSLGPVSSFHAATVPLAGLLFDISSPRLNELLAFHTGILYKKNKYYGYGLYQDPQLTVRNYITLHLQSLEVPLGVRYTFPARKITPFVDGGLAYSFNVRLRSSTVQEREQNNVVHTFYHEDGSLGTSQIGYWAGSGGIIKLRYGFDAIVELRFGRSNNIMMVDVLSRLRTFQVVVGLRTK